MAEGIGNGDLQPRVLLHRREGGIGQQVVHQGDGLLPVDIAAVVAVDDQRAAFVRRDGAQVHPEADAALRHLHAHARRFQHAAARIILPGIVAKDAENGGVAACGQAVGHRQRPAAPAARRPVKSVQRQRLQRRFARQLGQIGIGHAVADHKHIFHQVSLPFFFRSKQTYCATRIISSRRR